MNDLRHQLQGLWLPLVTPFRDGALDEVSLRRLVRHYAKGPVDGLILAATSGEGLTLSDAELERSSGRRAPNSPRAAATSRFALASPAQTPPGCRTSSTRPRDGRSTAI